MFNCLWYCESVEILCQVLNQMVAGQGPDNAAWFDHRFGGRGVVGKPVGAYSTGGRRNGCDQTLVIVLEGNDGNRIEVHWKGVREASSVAYWLSHVLRTLAGKPVECSPVHKNIVEDIAGKVYDYASHGGVVGPEDLPVAVDRVNRKQVYYDHVHLYKEQYLLMLQPVPMVR